MSIYNVSVHCNSDLSGTSIEALPSNGLDSLEILRIQNTHTLKTIPSVYNFKVKIQQFYHNFDLSNINFSFATESTCSVVNSLISLLCISISIQTWSTASCIAIGIFVGITKELHEWQKFTNGNRSHNGQPKCRRLCTSRLESDYTN